MRRSVDQNQRFALAVLNDLYLLEKKINKLTEKEALLRYTSRIKEHLEQMGFTVEDPIGQPFSETRTDCDASIAGESTENLTIHDVLKPIVRFRHDGSTFLVQRAVVIVKGS